MGSGIPKQFLPLKGRPLLFHTIEKFYKLVDEIVVVLPAPHFTYWNEMCEQHSFSLKIKLVEGGSSRTQSVINGLNTIHESGIVAIHDAVRPLVSRSLIATLLKEAAIHGNAIPMLPVTESLRHKSGEISVVVDRAEYMMVQTPQCFDLQVIKSAYQNLHQREFSDDASVIDYTGGKINPVAGEVSNIKITFRQDILFAEFLMDVREM